MNISNFKILVMGENVNVIQSENDPEYTPYILKDQMVYDPRDSFKPINAEKRQRKLAEIFLPEAELILTQAEAIYNEQEAAKQWEKDASQYEVIEKQLEPASTTKPNNPGSLEALIAQSIAEVSVNKILQEAKPVIDDYIVRTYGAMFDKIFEFIMQEIPALMNNTNDERK